MSQNCIGHHIMLRLFDDRVLAPTAAIRRLVARLIVRIGARVRIVTFGIVDTHLQVIALCDYRAAGAFVRAFTSAFQHRVRPGVRFQQSRRKPITDQQHLYAAVRYVLRQEKHHGVEPDPLRDGTSLPDLLGARAIDSHIAELMRRYLPRLRRTELLELFGAGDFESAPPDDSAVADAAAAAFALPDLASRTPAALAARRAAVHAAPHMTTRQLASTLGVSKSTVLRLRRSPVPPAHRRAVELQLRLRGAITRAEQPAPPSSDRVRPRTWRDSDAQGWAVNPARS